MEIPLLKYGNLNVYAVPIIGFKEFDYFLIWFAFLDSFSELVFNRCDNRHFNLINSTFFSKYPSPATIF